MRVLVGFKRFINLSNDVTAGDGLTLCLKVKLKSVNSRDALATIIIPTGF